MRRSRVLATAVACCASAALVLSGAFAGASLAAEPGAVANARIVGNVLVCNTPTHCLTRVFQVSAINGAGEVSATTLTSGTRNHYRLRVPAGKYSLLANSNGLECRGSATAIADHTVSANITCLVP